MRYSTTGSSALGERPARPPLATRRELALAHNGNLINAVELHAELRDQRRRLPLDLRLARSSPRCSPRTRPTGIEDALADVMPRLHGAYSTVVMTHDALIALRDPHGVRPLCSASSATAASSPRESCALDILGARVPARGRARRARSSIDEHGLRTRMVVEGKRERLLRLRVHLLRPPRLRMGGERAARRARAHGRDPRPRGARVDADLVIGVPDSATPPPAAIARVRRSAARRRPRQEPLRRPHLHPARPALREHGLRPEVQPAAGDHRGQAARRRRRLDRARQHDAPDRPDAARGRRARSAHAHLRAADPPPLPLRHRHGDARGDDRPRPQRRGGRRASSAPTRSPTCRSPGVYEAVKARPASALRRLLLGDYPLRTPRRTASSPSRTRLPMARVGA